MWGLVRRIWMWGLCCRMWKLALLHHGAKEGNAQDYWKVASVCGGYARGASWDCLIGVAMNRSFVWVRFAVRVQDDFVYVRSGFQEVNVMRSLMNIVNVQDLSMRRFSFPLTLQSLLPQILAIPSALHLYARPIAAADFECLARPLSI